MKQAVLFLSLLALAGPATAEKPAEAFIELDYAQLDRTIAKEPNYVAEPRYALFILDPAGRFRAWAVLDKSTEDLAYYDVVYFDKNGNGDLTESGERFVGAYDDRLASPKIHVGEVAVPGTGLVHTDVIFMTAPKGRKGVWFQMNWDGRERVVGGYDKAGIDYTAYALEAEDAPVLRPSPLGPLSFVCWPANPPILSPGKATRVSFLLGHRGSGSDTFCAVSEHFLTPKLDKITATLIAGDDNGTEVRSRTFIKQHC